MKKGGLLVALMGPKKKGSEVEPDEMPESQDEDGKIVAAEEILAAMESKDASALSEALTAFHDLC